VTWRLSGTAYPRFNLLRFRIARALTSALFRRVVQSFSAVLLVLVVAAGLFGDQTPTRNLAPTFIWIVWWVGFAYLSALVGNVWTFVNPWEALFNNVRDAFETGTAYVARNPSTPVAAVARRLAGRNVVLCLCVG
jgi:hypothetical protein